MEIKGFKVIEEIGAGGMASVYKAIQLSVDRVVALKVLSPHLIAMDPDFGKRFDRETKILAKFAHRGIVSVYDAGKDGDYYYIAMELLDGGTLTDRLESREISSVNDVLLVIRQIAAALAHSHEKGIIHRDIKPQNILFRSDGGREAVLADYGIARSINPDSSLTLTPLVIGSPRYMSPEQALGAELGPATDIFSLGVVFHQCLTGKLPFACKTVGELVIAQREAPPEALPSHCSHVQRLLDSMMRMRPEERIDAASLIAAIDQTLAGGTATVVRPQPVIPKQERDSHQPTSQTTGRSQWDERARTRPRLAIGLGILVGVLLLAGVGVLLYPEDETEPSQPVKKLPSPPTRAHEGVPTDRTGVKQRPRPMDDRLTPEVVYDYQAVLSQKVQPAAFLSKHPTAVLAPVIQIMRTRDPAQLEGIAQSAVEGDPVAQFLLSEIYDYGIVLEKSPVNALKWAHAAADQSYFLGRFQLLVLQEQHEGRSMGAPEALGELERLADEDVFLSKLILAKQYLAGSGGSSQWRRAVALLDAAALAGDYQSHELLAQIYQDGKYVERNLELARSHLREAEVLRARLLR